MKSNVVEAMQVADGVIVSTSLMLDGADPAALLRWDVEKAQRLMDHVPALPAGPVHV